RPHDHPLAALPQQLPQNRLPLLRLRAVIPAQQPLRPQPFRHQLRIPGRIKLPGQHLLLLRPRHSPSDASSKPCQAPNFINRPQVSESKELNLLPTNAFELSPNRYTEIRGIVFSVASLPLSI